jgi:hypothetical protein
MEEMRTLPVIAFILAGLPGFISPGVQRAFHNGDVKDLPLSNMGVKGRVESVQISPDRRLAAVTTSFKNSHRLYVVDLDSSVALRIDPRSDYPGYEEGWDGGPLSLLYPCTEQDPRWRPSGRHPDPVLAFSSNGIDDQFDIFLFSWNDRRITRVTVTPANETAPRWSDDGEALSYVICGVPGSREGTEIRAYFGMDGRWRQAGNLRLISNELPPLSPVFAREVFERPLLLCRTVMAVRDHFWIGRNPGFIGADAATGLDARIMRVDEDGRARQLMPARGVCAVRSFSDGTALCVAKRAVIDGIDMCTSEVVPMKSGHEAVLPRVQNVQLFGGRTLVFPPVPVGRSILAGIIFDRRQNRLAIAQRESGWVLASEPVAGLTGDTSRILAADFAAARQKDALIIQMLAAENTSGGQVLKKVEWNPGERYEDELERKPLSFYGGVRGTFVRYTGDAGEGVFHPGGSLFVEGRANSGFIRHFVAGARLDYFHLSSTSSLDESNFDAYMWSLSLCARYEHPVSNDISGYLNVAVGKVVLCNVRNKEGHKVKPALITFGAGAVFEITPRLRISAAADFCIMSEDVDAVRDISRNDSYLGIGAGFHYLLPL